MTTTWPPRSLCARAASSISANEAAASGSVGMACLLPSGAMETRLLERSGNAICPKSLPSAARANGTGSSAACSDCKTIGRNSRTVRRPLHDARACGILSLADPVHRARHEVFDCLDLLALGIQVRWKICDLGSHALGDRVGSPPVSPG